MRRPVKPFVTEYRGGSRRPSGHGSGLGLDLFKPDPAQSASSPSSPSPSSPSPFSPSPWPLSPQPSLSGPQEDSYEAALRAADALFAGTRTAATDEPRSVAPPTPAGEAAKPTPPTTGRVLRVLDEPPTPEMLELQRLEAEHAPKRRGRKPGSKNKPKVAALVAAPSETLAPPPKPPRTEAPRTEVPRTEVPRTKVPQAIPSAAAASPRPAASVTAALAARAIATAPARRPDEPRSGERYAWVRTRLKPGQQWKRRLPKVAW